jgi:hypothetical protein
MAKLLQNKKVLIGAGACLIALIAIICVIFVIRKPTADSDGDAGAEYTDPGYDSTFTGYNDGLGGDPEWRAAVLSAPLIAEIEHQGVKYEARVYNTTKYYCDSESGELILGSTSGDATGTVLRDWVTPLDPVDLEEDDALFEGCWANVGTRLRGLVAYCDDAYEIVTRARTADYLEYVYKNADGDHFRIAATDDYVLYRILDFSYIFDVNAY